MRSLERELRIGKFNTKCGHQVSISEVKSIEGMYEGYKRLEIKGGKVNALNGKSETRYFWSWEELEFKLIKFFGYIPEIEKWISDGSKTEIRFINWQKKPKKSDGINYQYASFEQFCIINGREIRIIDLAHEILKEDRLEYTAQGLINRIVEEFFYQVGGFSEEQVKEKIHEMNSIGLKNIVFRDGEGGGFDFEMNWRNFKSEMEYSPEIKYRGEKRGRLYRHILTRPRLPDKLIANLLTRLMKRLEPEYAEIDRTEMYNRVSGKLMSLHKYIETDDATPVPPVELDIEQRKEFEENLKKLALELKVDSLIEDYSWNHGGDFVEWSLETYTREWFLQSWGNISLEMKKFGARPGTKRGTWTMYPKPRKQLSTRQSTEEIMRLIERTVREIIKISEISEDVLTGLEIGHSGLGNARRIIEREINHNNEENNDAK